MRRLLKETITMLSMAMVAIMTMSSCEREPALFLCDHNVTGPSRIAVDWTHFKYFETPTGMTLKLFERTDSGYELINSTSTNDIAHVDYLLPPGDYADFVINQSESEFGLVTFTDVDNWAKARVNTIRGSSTWYKDTITTSPLVTDLEWVGTDSHNGVTLTQQMLDSAAGGLITIDTLRPRNIVRTVTVYVHIKNIGSLRSARASLEGMAGSYWLGLGHTTDEKVTQLLEDWHMTIDSVAPYEGRTDSIEYGTIVARVASFGLPDGHSKKPDDNILHLECLLKNDSVLKYDYQVGDRFEYKVEDETNININVDLHFVIDITMEDPLPDVPDDSKNASSGFEVTIDDWGAEQTVPINM